jgi:hypothetical protein
LFKAWKHSRSETSVTNQGVGRFTKLGIPFPDITATFIGGLEIIGGLLLIAGLLTRFIAIPFVIEMIVAILSTKIGLYLGTSPLPMPPALPKSAFGQRRVSAQVRTQAADPTSRPSHPKPPGSARDAVGRSQGEEKIEGIAASATVRARAGESR